MIRFARSLSIPVLVLVCSGCGGEDETYGESEQHGTAAQDAEVATLKRRFGEAVRTTPDMSKDRDVPYFLPYADRTTKKTRTWSCNERDARKNSPQKSTVVTYALTVDADETKLTNTGTGFGKVFVLTFEGFTGYPAGNVQGDLVTHDFLRAKNERFYVERVTHPAVATLSPAEQKNFDKLKTEYEGAYSVADGLAIAYVECTTFTE